MPPRPSALATSSSEAARAAPRASGSKTLPGRVSREVSAPASAPAQCLPHADGRGSHDQAGGSSESGRVPRGSQRSRAPCAARPPTTNIVGHAPEAEAMPPQRGANLRPPAPAAQATALAPSSSLPTPSRLPPPHTAVGSDSTDGKNTAEHEARRRRYVAEEAGSAPLLSHRRRRAPSCCCYVSCMLCACAVAFMGMVGVLRALHVPLLIAPPRPPPPPLGLSPACEGVRFGASCWLERPGLRIQSAAALGAALLLSLIVLGQSCDTIWRGLAPAVKSGALGRRICLCLRRHGGSQLVRWSCRAWASNRIRAWVETTWEKHGRALWINGRGDDFVAMLMDMLPCTPSPTGHAGDGGRARANARERGSPGKHVLGRGSSTRYEIGVHHHGRKKSASPARAVAAEQPSPETSPSSLKIDVAAIDAAAIDAAARSPRRPDAGYEWGSDSSAETDSEQEELELAAIESSARERQQQNPTSVDRSMGSLRRGQLSLLAVLLPLVEIHTSTHVVWRAASQGVWADAALIGTALVFGGVCNALTASWRLFPCTPGLDLTAKATWNEEEGSELLRRRQQQQQLEPYPMRMGVFLIDLPTIVVLVLGATGLAVPVQAIHDVWLGVETISLVELRRWSSVLLSAPLLYCKLFVATKMGFRAALETESLLVISCVLSAAATAIGITAAWTSPCVSPDRRVYAAQRPSSPLTKRSPSDLAQHAAHLGMCLGKTVIDRRYSELCRSSAAFIACASFVLADVLLRALVIGIVMRPGSALLSAHSDMFVLFACFVLLLVCGRVAVGSQKGPHLGILRSSCLQLLAPHTGAMVNPRFLTVDALLSTCLYLVIGSYELSPSLLHLQWPRLEYSTDHDTADVISLATCLVVLKIGVFFSRVLPMRAGGVPVCMHIELHRVDGRDGRALLHHAAACGSDRHTERHLTRMVARHPSLSIERLANLVDCYGRTPLSLACSAGHCQVAALLVSRGADMEHADVFGRTALLHACGQGQEAMARDLLARGASIHHRDHDDANALLMSAAGGHESTARLLLAHGARLESMDNFGGTALQCACANGHARTAKMLLEAQASIEHQDNDGRTALMWASASGHETVAQTLLERNANIEHLNHAGHSSLIRACTNGHLSTARMLLRHGANLEQQSRSGATALLHASHHGQEAVAKLLLEHRAALEHQTKQQWTALLLACSGGHTGTARMLIAQGSELEHSDENGYTPLLHAVDSDHVATAKMLVDCGAHLEHRDVDGRTALLWCCMRGHVRTAQLLIEHGASINTRSYDGRTPLMWACASDHAMIVRLLLSNHATVRHMDCEGDTALSLAERRGFDHIAEIMRTHGTEWWRSRQLMITLSRELMMLREFPPWASDAGSEHGSTYGPAGRQSPTSPSKLEA